MQLKRLEAYGFKSFAEKTEIVFHRGITAIVGPNGSGKSNITDAIRWVLGEQNTRNLRAAKAEDIIFAGSSTRRPLNVAEVSLVFDNDDGTLPLDYQEVVVTRRLFRSGESESYINHTRCRIKDVYQLFADTGIGHEGMSIIGQNRIDRILNSRPEERRAFFEETAGITKYKARKGEALRKLEATEKNLVRVQDIMQEIHMQLTPLAEHAEKTRTFEKLSGEYRRCEISTLSERHGQLMEERAAHEAKKKGVQDQQLSLATKIKEKEAVKERVKLLVVKQEASLQKFAQREQELQEQAEHLQAELAARRERCANEQSTRARLRKQQEETAQELRLGEASAADLSEALATLAHDEILLQQKISAAREDDRQMVSALAEARKSLDAARTAEEEQRACCQAHRQKLAVMENAIALHAQNKQERDQQREAGEARIKALCARRDTLQEELAQLQEENAQFRKRMEEAAVASRKAQEQLAAERTKRQDMSAQAKGIESRHKLLERMQQAHEGFGAGVRAVLKNSEPWHRGICGAVAELIEVPKQYVTAVEVALAGSQQHVVTSDEETAKAAIAYLKRQRLGRVTFLPLTTLVVQSPAKAAAALEMAGAIGYANRLVRVKEQYRRAVDFLLGRTLVVDTLEHALSIARAMKWHQRIVTLEGELLHPGGSLSGGSRAHRETSFLGRRSALFACKEELQALQAQAKECEERIAVLEVQSAGSAQEQEKLAHSYQAQLVRLAELRTALTAEGETLRTQEERLRTFSEEQEVQQQSFAKAQKTLSIEKSQLRLAEKKLKQLMCISEGKQEEVDDLAEDANALRRQIFECEKRQAVLVAQKTQDNARLQEAQQRIMREKQSLCKVQEEISSMESQGETNRAELAALESEQEQLSEARNDLRQQKDDCYKKKMRLLEEEQEAERGLKAFAAHQRDCQVAAHQLDLQLSRIAYAAGECEQTLLSTYGLTPELAEAQRLPGPVADITKRLQELKREIEALGPVNPDAVREYEEQKQRLDFMQRQAQDLTDARGDLTALIQEMDDTMTKQFQKAFAEIQRYFQQSFTKLFGGGKAELKLLDEEDVLHAGIEILVTLPHKKRQGLPALSGGERALTVIALLFAFLSYKPSPFSVLDEIDAPLDEANVVRFGQFLRELCHATQFIVVTHRKGTMEAADTMYGVTTDGAGVSQVLSVKLDEAERH